MQKADYQRLRECPHCGGEARLTKLNQKGFNGEFKVFVQCSRCKARTNVAYPMPHYSLEARKEVVIKAWNNRTEPVAGITATENAPLALDELHAMNGCPVWCVDHQGNGKWALVHAAEEICTDADFGDWEFYSYGWTDSDVGWLAYRCKPEGGVRG